MRARLPFLAALALSCGDGGGDPPTSGAGGSGGMEVPDVSAGELVYRTPIEGGNSFACVTCHALQEPPEDGLRRPGHAIGDAANRPSYKNGLRQELRDAVNVCVTEWMTGEALEASDERWIELERFLQVAAGSRPAPALVTQRAVAPRELPGGDAEQGRAIFHVTCVGCHGDGGVGTNRAPPLEGGLYEPAYIASRVRTGGPEGSTVYPNLSGGRMPFWAEDRMSDDELRDVIAYVLSIGETGAGGAGGAGGEGGAGGAGGDGGGGGEGGAGGEGGEGGLGGEGGGGSGGAGGTGGAGGMGGAGGTGGAGGGSGCGKTHERVGHVATLKQRFHGVNGKATILDDCTIQLTEFDYDARGIIVEVYGALKSDFKRGFAISENLVRRKAYVDETLTLTLPEDRTLDDLDSISIWCVDVAVSFGDGTFAAP